MPDVPGPEGLLAEHEHAKDFADRIPKQLRSRFTSEQPIEARHVNFVDPCTPPKTEPVRHIWLRASDQLPKDPNLHRCLLAFVRFARTHTPAHTHKHTNINSAQITTYFQHPYFHTVHRFGRVTFQQLRSIIPYGFIEK